MAKASKDNGLGKLAIVVIVLGLTSIWYRSGSKQEFQAKNKPIQPQGIELLPDSSPKGEKVSTSRHSQSVAQNRQALAMRRQLKLQAIDISGQDPVRLPVVVKVKPQWCQVGDLDIIKASLGGQAKSRILLSLEPLARSQDLKPQLRIVTENDLNNGFTHVFNLAAKHLEGGFGLYLCRDSQGQGSCQSKKVYRIQELGDAYFNRQSTVKVEQDPIFYFQFLLSDGKSIELSTSDHANDEYFKQLDLYASRHISHDGDRRAVLGKSRQLHTDLSSVPAIVNDNSIEITLPFMDPNCMTNDI